MYKLKLTGQNLDRVFKFTTLEETVCTYLAAYQ
jgi:hypothetical protein